MDSIKTLISPNNIFKNTTQNLLNLSQIKNRTMQKIESLFEDRRRKN